jgi:type IV secretory pathway VirB4 component
MELFTSGSLNAFAHKTNVDVRNRLIDYNIMDLGAQLKTMGLLVITDAMINRVTDNWRRGKRTHIFLDEFHVVFENEYSGTFFNSAWRRFRKRNGYPTGITQNVEYLLDSVLASTMRYIERRFNYGSRTSARKKRYLSYRPQFHGRIWQTANAVKDHGISH